MEERIVFPDAVDMVVEAVRTDLALPRPDVVVGAKVPNPRPARFVSIERVGGIQRNLVCDQPMVSLEAWSDRSDDAYSIAALCRAIVGRMPGHSYVGSMCYRVDEVGGMQHSPDPESDQERYLFTVQLVTRGVAA